MGYINLTNVATNQNIRIKKDSDQYQQLINDSNWVTSSSVYSKTRYRNKLTGEIRLVSKDDQDTRNDPNWEYWSTGRASFRNIRTGETCVLAADDPRRFDGEWESTSKHRASYYNPQTRQIKSFSQKPNAPWVSVSAGKRMYVNTKTGERRILMIYDDRIHSLDWVICDQQIFLNIQTKSITAVDRRQYDLDPNVWVPVNVGSTTIINVFNGKMKRLEDLNQLNTRMWFPKVRGKCLVFDTIDQKVTYINKDQRCTRYRSTSKKISMVNVQSKRFYMVPIALANLLKLKHNWMTTHDYRKKYKKDFRACVDVITKTMYYLPVKQITGNLVLAKDFNRNED